MKTMSINLADVLWKHLFYLTFHLWKHCSIWPFTDLFIQIITVINTAMMTSSRGTATPSAMATEDVSFVVLSSGCIRFGLGGSKNTIAGEATFGCEIRQSMGLVLSIRYWIHPQTLFWMERIPVEGWLPSRIVCEEELNICHIAQVWCQTVLEWSTRNAHHEC